MIRISGRNLSGNNQLKFALTPIKGVGKNNVKKVLDLVWEELQKSKTAKDFKSKEEFTTSKLNSLSEDVIVIIRNIIENQLLTEEDLRRQNMADIKRLTDLQVWRGLRHKLGLPVRGQQTRTNSRTRRGNKRMTKGSGRAKAAAKT